MLKKIPFRRIRWPGWVVLFVIGFSLVYGMAQLVVGIGFDKDSGQASLSSINFETVTEKTDTYTMSIKTPVIGDSTIHKPIQGWIKQEKEAFLAAVKENKDELGDGYRAHLIIQADVKKATDDTYSIIFNSYQLVNDIRGQQQVKIYTIDASEKRILHLSDIMQTSGKPIHIIRNQILKNESINLVDDKMDKVLSDPASWNWSISPRALTLYFEESEIAAKGAGPIQVEIPIKLIRPYLNNKTADALGTSEGTPVNVSIEPEGKYVALTFDDGPNVEVTPRILKILKAHDVQATFFMLGSQAEKYPSLAKRVAEAGHEIGNHTDHHQDLTKIGRNQVAQEIQISSRKIEEATGQIPSSLRPPYGAINHEVVEVAGDYGSPIVLWSVDSLDWKNKNADSINRVVQKEITPGSIILLHDVHPTTADALPTLLTTLKKEGYHFVTVSQLQSVNAEESAGPYYGNI
jgi:peptidoglycan-N-acetylglucosamine deacetylase